MSTLRGLSLTLIIKAVSIVSQLALFILVARTTSTAVVALFALATAAWALCRSLLPVGWNIAILRRTAVLHSEDRAGQAIRLLRYALIETALTGIGLTVALVACFVVAGIEVKPIWLAAAAVGICFAEIGILSVYLRAVGWLVVSQLFDGLVVYGLPFIGCLLWLGWGALSFSVIILAHLIGAATALLLMAAVVVARKPPAAVWPLEPSWLVGERRSARRMFWPQVFGTLSSRAAVLLTPWTAGVNATAIIETGLRAQLVGATMAWAGGTVASPRYAVAHHTGQRSRFIMLSTVTWAALLPTVAVVVALALWGQEILGILGPAYASEQNAVLTMAAASVVELPASTGGYVLMMTGRERVATLGSVIQLSVIALLTAVLGPTLGAFGVALAVLSASACRTIVTVVALFRDGIPGPLSLAGLQPLWQRMRIG